MKKSRELRCPSIVRTKSGKEVRCGAFLLEIDRHFLKIKCKKCGYLWLVSKDSSGLVDLHGCPQGTAAIPQKEENKDA